MVKKLTLIFFITVALFSISPSTSIYSVDFLDKTCQESGVTGSSFCENVSSESSKNRILGSEGIITKITQAAVYLTGAISLVVVTVGGFRYAISGGDSNAITVAKNTILYALVGLSVAIFAQAMVSFVLSKL